MKHITAIFFAILMGAATPVFALTDSAAESAVETVVTDINKIIASNTSTASKIKKFDAMLKQYADITTIARSALGPPARSLSKSELNSYAAAFRGYLAVKYGSQFETFMDGKLSINQTVNRGKFHEVHATASRSAGAPVSMVFRISDRSGKTLLFDIIIEGISLLSTEAVEVRNIYKQQGSNIAKLTKHLNSVG